MSCDLRALHLYATVECDLLVLLAVQLSIAYESNEVVEGLSNQCDGQNKALKEDVALII